MIYNLYIKYKSNIFNILIRLITMLSKFILVLYLAKHFTSEQLGIYGLFVVTISYSLYLVGIEFHRYSQRNLLGKPFSQWNELLKNQIVFYILSYCIFFPILFFIFFYDFLDYSIMVYFYFILLLEHITQEASRLLVTMKKPLEANIVTFIKAGIWVYIVIVLMYYNETLNELETIWIAWLIGNIISFYLIYRFTKELCWTNIIKSKINIFILKNGFRTSLPFLVVIIASRGIFTFDRYFIDYFFNKSLVGVYTFYIGIANAIQTFIDAGVVMYLYPKMIEAYNNKDFIKYNKFKSEMFLGISVMFFIMMIGTYILIEYILEYINKDIYWNNLNILWFLCLSTFFINLSVVFDHSLYAKRNDKVLVKSSIYTLMLFILLVSIFIYQFNVLSIPLAMCCVFAFALSYKYYYDRKEKV